MREYHLSEYKERLDVKMKKNELIGKYIKALEKFDSNHLEDGLILKQEILQIVKELRQSSFSDITLSESEIVEVLDIIIKYNLLQKIKIEFKDTYTDNNFHNGNITYKRLTNNNISPEFGALKLIDKIQIRFKINRLMSSIGCYHIAGFCYPAILLTHFYENCVNINKATRSSSTVEYSIFYDNEINNYNYFNMIEVNMPDELENDYLFKIVGEMNLRMKDIFKVNVNISKFSAASFGQAVEYVAQNKNCPVEFWGDINFDKLDSIKINC